MTAQTRRELIAFFKTPAAKTFFAMDRRADAMDENVGSQARIITNALQKKFNQLFSKKAKGLATSMVNDADRASSGTLHSSLKELSGGLSLKTSVITGPMKEVMAAQIAENVTLIKSISAKYQDQVQGAVMRSITTGNGLADLVPAIMKYDDMTIRRARFIADDQTKKAMSNLNAERMRKLGVQKYTWIHSGGGREPRELHLSLDSKIFSLDEPPIIQYATGTQPEVRGKPGDLPNCRCVMAPVISFEE